MAHSEPNDSRRLGPSDYFAEASSLLANGSHADLTISALCDALGVSKGSFYHHFGGLQGFVEAFLRNWERETTLDIKAMAEDARDTKERHRLFAALATRLPHDAEGAIRVWGRTDPAVRAVVQRVDKERIAMLGEAFGPHMSAAQARQLAELYHLVLAGMQAVERPVSVSHLKAHLKVLAELVVAKHGERVFGRSG